MNTESCPAKHVSLGLSRAGLLPGHRVKRRLRYLDTTYMVVAYGCLFIWVLGGMYCGDLYWKQHHPNAWPQGIPANPSGDLIDVIVISTSVGIGIFIVTNLVRFVAKLLVFLSGWFTPDEIRTFPIDTDGRVWSLRSPKAPLKPWPIEWQEPVPESSSDDKRGWAP